MRHFKKSAVIFDMDGVISDTQSLHEIVERELLREYGILLTPQEIREKYAGVSDNVMFRDLLEHRGITAPTPEQAVREKWKRMRARQEGHITPIPGAKDLMERLRKDGLKLALASASPRSFIHEVLSTLRFESYFEAVVSAEEVSHGKPAPDIFLRAAELLKVRPRDIVVVEDGRSGMLGARIAGMACIGLVPDTAIAYPASTLVSRLEDVEIAMIHSLAAP